MPPRSEKPAKAQSTVTFNPEDGHLTAVDHQLNRQYDAEILAAVLGYAMYDFVNWIAHFGNWNARELDLPHVDMIEKDYKNAGIDNISVLTAIFLVVDSSLIDTTALVQEQDLNEDVPLIKWSIEAVPETDAASGHHRITALLRYLKSLEDEITSFDTTIQALLAGNKAESTGTVKKIDRLQMRKAIVQGKLDKGGWWLVRVHDASKLSLGALKRLSENIMKPVLASTDEEALVTALYSLISIKDDLNFIPANFAKSIAEEGRKHTTQTKMVTLFYNIPLIEILVDLLRWGKHFRSAPIYRVKYLASKVVGTSCGVLVTILKMLNDNLCRLLIPIDQAFQLQPDGVDLLANVKSMRKFLDMGQNDALRETAGISMDDWQRHFDRLEDLVNIDPSGYPINYSLLSPFLAAFDEVAEEELGKPFEARGFLKHAPDMNLRVSFYLDAVLTKIAPLLHSATFPGASQIASKITLMCYARNDTHAAYPLLSLFIISILAEALAAYPNALKEISRWFEALVDFLVGKTAGMSSNDFTTEAISAILLNKNWMPNAHIKFAQCLLSFRTTALEALEAELTRYPVRAVDKNTYSDALATRSMDVSEPKRNAILRNASLPFDNDVVAIVTAMRKAAQPSFKFKRSTPDDSFKGTTIGDMDCALPLRHSFIPWMQIISKAQSRECPALAVASMYEWYTVSEYRRDLLQSQGGLMRRHFLEDMGATMNPLRLINVEGTPFLPWWDGIYVNPTAIKLDMDNTNLVAAGKVANSLLKDLESIFQKVSTSPAARLVSGRIPLAKGKKGPIDATVNAALGELMKTLELNVARSVQRAQLGNNAPFFLDQQTSAHRSWVPTVTPVSDMDTFAEYPKDGNVSALVAARITANLQTARTTSSSRKGKAKGPAKGKGKGKARVEPKSQMSSETDDSQESSANEIIQACDIDDGELLKAVHASKLPVKVGASSRVSNDPWVPAAVASLDTISYPMPQGNANDSDTMDDGGDLGDVAFKESDFDITLSMQHIMLHPSENIEVLFLVNLDDANEYHGADQPPSPFNDKAPSPFNDKAPSPFNDKAPSPFNDKASTPSRGSIKRQRASSVPKVSYKKPKVKLRGGVDSDEGMEPVDETTLVSSGGGHPV